MSAHAARPAKFVSVTRDPSKLQQTRWPSLRPRPSDLDGRAEYFPLCATPSFRPFERPPGSPAPSIRNAKHPAGNGGISKADTGDGSTPSNAQSLEPALHDGRSRALAAPSIARPSQGPEEAWGLFKDRFVTGGRIIDTGNGGVSHSEGQGIALLAAAQLGDRACFDRILSWTSETLRRPYDHLHSWRFRPGQPVPVDDPNNATDGDLLITMALYVAASRWDQDSYRTAAAALARDISRALMAQTSRGLLLLPGIAGFRDRSSVTLNPSYYMFPALQRIAAETGDPAWQKVTDDGLALLRSARFGRWNLPPDWLVLPAQGEPEPAGKWPARFSFDAVRVPLYLCWAGHHQSPVVEAVHAYWSSHPRDNVPAWTDLRSEQNAPYLQSQGMYAIRQYVASTVAPTGRPPYIPSVAGAQDYYSAALILLVNLAMAAGSNPIA
eukprot:gene12532-12621_t